jgi:predicted MFS family arabinose efflux permease
MLRSRALRTICWVLTLENIAEVAGYVMLVLLAREQLGLDARGYGLLLASSAVGGLLGAAVAERLHRQAGDAGSLVVATAAMAGGGARAAPGPGQQRLPAGQLGASSLGAAVGGLVAAALGLRAVYAGAAVLVALLAVVLWWRLDAAAFAVARQAAVS